jgi:hypothetical protein
LTILQRKVFLGGKRPKQYGPGSEESFLKVARPLIT